MVTSPPKSFRLPALRLQLPTVVWAILVEFVIFALFAPGFISPANLISVTVQAAPLIILSLGAAIVLISGGLDLSLGFLFTLAMSVAAIMLRGGIAWELALAAALVVGMLGGLTNGLLVAVLGIPPFLATLGTMGIFHGLSLGITELGSVAVEPGPTYFLGEGEIVGVPVPVILAALVFVACQVLVYRTAFGNYLYAIGSNQEAAQLSGVNVTRWKTGIYVLAGLLAGVTGIVLLGRMHASHPNIGFGWEFDAVAAAVIGGIAIEGGRGKLYAAVFGALFIAILRNGMNFMEMSNYYQTFAKGAVIIAAIVLDVIWERRRRARRES